jgi:hypothetical protein
MEHLLERTTGEASSHTLQSVYRRRSTRHSPRPRAIEDAGFEIEEWRTNEQYRFMSERADNATQKYGVTSVSVLATRR